MLSLRSKPSGEPLTEEVQHDGGTLFTTHGRRVRVDFAGPGILGFSLLVSLYGVRRRQPAAIGIHQLVSGDGHFPQAGTAGCKSQPDNVRAECGRATGNEIRTGNPGP